MPNVNMKTALDLWKQAETLVKDAQKVVDAPSVDVMETCLFNLHFNAGMMMQDIRQKRIEHQKTGV